MRTLDFISKAFFPCCNLLKFRLPSLSFTPTLQTQRLLASVNGLAISQGRFYTIQTNSVFNLRNTSSVFQNVNSKRHASAKASDNAKFHSRSVLYYVLALAIFMIGVAYAGAPLYRIFCQVVLLVLFEIFTDYLLILYLLNFFNNCTGDWGYTFSTTSSE